MKKTLAIIPARGESQGVPRKNIRLLAGKPLIAHTIEHALRSQSINRTIVSTEDAEIARIAQDYGAEVVLRPAEFSTDTASSESALIHVLDHLGRKEGYEPDYVVFMQCTSPIREPQDIDRAMDLILKEGADSLFSATPWHGFLWRENHGLCESLNYDYSRRPRRQELVPQYRESGSIFIMKPWVLRKLDNRLGGKIVMYRMGFWSAFEIDSLEDFGLCELILSRKGGT